MKAISDIEAVNLSSGTGYQRVSGNGDSRLLPVRLGPGGHIKTEEEKAAEERDFAEFVEEVQRKFNNERNDAMHYRNGREAKNGDKIVQIGGYGGSGAKVVALGVLFDATPGNDFCNGLIAPIQTMPCACLCDCLHIDDLEELLKNAGLDKRPEGK
jgi:hypothetical protein